MKINYNQIRGHHNWVKENMTDSKDGKIYGCSNTYYEITVDGEFVGEVFDGEFKASEEDRKKSSNGNWWFAYKNGQVVGKGYKSRKKAILEGLLG